MIFRRYLRSILDFLFPSVCPSCSFELAAYLGLCPACHAKLTPLSLSQDLRCSECSRPLASNSAYAQCSVCHRDPPRDVDLIDALFIYENDMRDFILHYKIAQHFNLKRLFAFLLVRSQFFCDAQRDGFMVIPVPSRKNSFGSMNLISKELHDFYGISSQVALFSHAKKSQKTLGYTQRQSNLENQMTYKGRVPDKVLLIDDILTTGATMKEAARVLRSVGVKEIRFLALSIVPDLKT